MFITFCGCVVYITSICSGNFCLGIIPHFAVLSLYCENCLALLWLYITFTNSIRNWKQETDTVAERIREGMSFNCIGILSTSYNVLVIEQDETLYTLQICILIFHSQGGYGAEGPN